MIDVGQREMDIIATFVPRSDVPPLEDVRRPPAGASLIELRADLLPPDCDLGALVRAATLPVVLTLRSRAEGGEGPDDAGERRSFFARATSWPVALVDLEAARDLDLLGAVVPGERAIVSVHLSEVPADLENRVRSLLATPARLVKAVPAARSVSEVAAVLKVALALGIHADQRRRTVLHASGEVARITRLLCPFWGARVCYAAWDAGRRAATGQLLPEEILALTGHLDAPPRRLHVIIGQPVSHSLSPRMHGAAYRALALPYLFAPLEVATVEELGALLTPAGEGALDALGCDVGGLAVTMPWKMAALGRCTVVAPRAARARAVNTVLPRRGKLLGDCTDIDGVTRALLDTGMAFDSARALVLGTGGAARAAAVALDLAGARVAMLSRDPLRARLTAAELGVEAVADPGACGACSVLVNATPAGAAGEPGPVLEALSLPAGAVVVDLPYGELPTGLERLAATRGWRYVSGRKVLLWQGVAQFAAMTGSAPPVTAMAAALGLET
jgi:3-dehydroquinate dehydratase type I